MPVNQTLCHVAASNFQYILDKCPDTDIVLSTTWRELFDMDWLKAKLKEYGIDTARVIGKTDVIMRGFSNHVRGDEIQDWLDKNPGYDRFCIIDDNDIGNGFEQQSEKKKCIAVTSWKMGLTLDQALDAIYVLGGHSQGNDLSL